MRLLMFRLSRPKNPKHKSLFLAGEPCELALGLLPLSKQTRRCGRANRKVPWRHELLPAT
jgi:hypothetical protein